MHPVTLHFRSAALEADFREEYAETSARPTRAAIAFVAVLYAISLFYDPGVYARYESLVAVIVAGIVAVLAVVVALTWRSSHHHRSTQLVAVAVLTTAAGLLVLLAVTPDDIAGFFHAGLGLVIVGTGTLFHLRFPIALWIALSVIAAYEIVSWQVGIAGDVVLSGTVFLVSSTVLAGFAAHVLEQAARQSFLDREALEEERDRSERLLLNVLPRLVAERLKDESVPIADHHAEATVLFTDMAGFVAFQRAVSPDDLVGHLHDLFARFDEVVRSHGMEKIKTVGDAYMAVAGVPEPVPDHVARVADAALAIRGTVDRFASAIGHRLAVRIGIDTGPLVAGVIGEEKFSYDVWGDPVTTASRMESHGAPGRIQVTARVRDRLEGRYRFESRGTVEVKGIGPMELWWLEGKA